MTELPRSERIHLEAAKGWFGLGNYAEANEALARIAPEVRGHPDVLEVRWHIFAAAKNWRACTEIAQEMVEQAPTEIFGWSHRSFALYELGQVEAAADLLFPCIERFPDDLPVQYNLAIYLTKLGRLKEARDVLERVFAHKNVQNLKSRALKDPDFEPVWQKIGEL